MAIFSDMVERSIEVFMYDFSVIGASFDNCLNNLELVLKKCEETKLVLNWETCHFMVQEDSAGTSYFRESDISRQSQERSHLEVATTNQC